MDGAVTVAAIIPTTGIRAPASLSPPEQRRHVPGYRWLDGGRHRSRDVPDDHDPEVHEIDAGTSSANGWQTAGR